MTNELETEARRPPGRRSPAAEPASDHACREYLIHAGDRATLTAVIAEASRILDAALQLSDGERAEIAAILTDSIGDGSSPEEIEASWIAEAKRRLAAYRRGESTPVDLEDAMRELESKRTCMAKCQVGPGAGNQGPLGGHERRRPQ